GNRPGRATFSVPRVGQDGLWVVIDVGPKEVANITLSDFPDPSTFTDDYYSPEAIVGHSYIVYHRNYLGKITYGAVQVLELGSQNEWVRLKFKRVAIVQ